MQPRIQIVAQPTPLVPLPRLSETLGIDLWIKRDDLAGPSFGGNKARQLEYYFGAAEAAGADTVLITGAVQSNFVRLAAATAAARGLRAVIQLEERVAESDPAYRRRGNVFLSQLLGATLLAYPEGEDEAGADAALYAEADTLSRAGRRPYVIPLAAGHPPLGALGYVDGAAEILAQKNDFDVFVVGSGSGMTHAGLLAGLRGHGSNARVIGGCVRRGADLQGPRIAGIVERLQALYPGAAKVAPGDVCVWDGALRPGYGHAGPPALAAITEMARCEGLILDPVYTAKSYATIPSLVASGQIAPGSRVCFVHTGGLGAFSAYEDKIADLLGAQATGSF